MARKQLLFLLRKVEKRDFHYLGGEKMAEEYMIEAQSGAAVLVKSGSKIEIIDVEGQQVVDFFAVNPTDPK